MFGAIQTTREQNGNLNEKAGREGFKENEAYRQFRRVLENFLVQLAADFFVDGGRNAETFQDVRIELNRKEEVRKRRERRTRDRQARLTQDLERVFSLFDGDAPARMAEEIRRRTEERLRLAASAGDNRTAAAEMLRVQAETRRELMEFKKRLTVVKPAGFGLTKGLQREWSSYREQAARFEKEVHMPLAIAVDRLVGEIAEETSVPLDRRKQVTEAVDDNITEAKRNLQGQLKSLSEVAEATRLTLLEAGRASITRFEETVRQVEGRLAVTDLTSMPDEEFYGFGEKLAAEIVDTGELEVKAMADLRDRVSRATAPATEDEPAADELTEVFEEELTGLREEMNVNLELAQVGMALGIVQHEFRAAVREVRANIRALSPWAHRNVGLRPIHRGLRTAFEHLDGYLTMFAPLDRRLRRTKVGLSGERVLGFLRELFESRLEQKGAAIIATDAFRERELFGYPSTFLPVFVNLIDNALHWLPDVGQGPREVLLDVDGPDLTVADTGTGVPTRDRDAVFEYGFSRKPGGRGLGLHISRQVLRRLGWDLRLDETGVDVGARFRLVPPAEDPTAVADQANGRAPL